MKPVDKKDMPKLIALIGLTICSLGYGVYNLVAGVSYGQPAAPTKPTEPTPTPPPTPAQVASGFPMDDLKRLEQLPEPVLARDPFISNAPPASPAPPAATPAPPAPAALPNPAVKDTVGRGTAEKAWTLMDKLRLGVMPSFKPGSSAADRIRLANGGGDERPNPPTDPLVLPSPEPPKIVVTGALIAEPGEGKSVVLLRFDGDSRWVSVGDRIGSEFVVSKIRRTDSGSEMEVVDSRNNKRRYTYKVN